MANILQMLSKESIVEMKKKTQVEFCDFDFSSYTYFYKSKKSFVEMKKETTIPVEYFINDFTSYTQKFKKKKRCNRRFNSKNIPNYPKCIIYSSFK